MSSAGTPRVPTAATLPVQATKKVTMLRSVSGLLSPAVPCKAVALHDSMVSAAGNPRAPRRAAPDEDLSIRIPGAGTMRRRSVWRRAGSQRGGRCPTPSGRSTAWRVAHDRRSEAWCSATAPRRRSARHRPRPSAATRRALTRESVAPNQSSANEGTRGLRLGRGDQTWVSCVVRDSNVASALCGSSNDARRCSRNQRSDSRIRPSGQRRAKGSRFCSIPTVAPRSPIGTHQSCVSWGYA